MSVVPHSEIACPTPSCADAIVRYGAHYHSVVRDKDGAVYCERCGGRRGDDGTWTHRCTKCSKGVEPGALTGLFVPHLCQECEQARADRDKARGNVCLKCGTVRSRCYC